MESFPELKSELDAREVSRRDDPEGRSEIAAAIKDIRNIQEITSYQAALEGMAAARNADLAERLGSRWVKIKEFLSLGDKEADQIRAEIDGLLANRESFDRDLASIKAKLGKFTKQKALPRAEEVRDNYYEEIANTPLSNEKKRELLKPEALAELSTEEYIALWRRLNPYYLSHVTRQGFRDHVGMFYHSAGINAFSGGFEEVLKDKGLIRPPMALAGLKGRDERSVLEWLKKGDILSQSSYEEAEKQLESVLHFTLASAPRYPDKTAVHFAGQEVADSHYGGEAGNEVFFIFPSDVLASQFNFTFNGWDKTFTKPQGETKWNDIFVWQNTTEDPGISINAGIVFLPKDRPVDSQTGSKYASEVISDEKGEARTMIEDPKKIEAFIAWGKRAMERPELKKMLEAIWNRSHSAYSTGRENEEMWKYTVGRELKDLGIESDVARALASRLIRDMHFGTSSDEELLKILREEEGQWKMAENPIPAEKYWEDYFTKNPHLRPKHIVYYDGDPTAAVERFLREKGIGKADTSKEDGVLLGFEDHHIEKMSEDPRSNLGYDELRATAMEIIRKRYGITSGS